MRDTATTPPAQRAITDCWNSIGVYGDRSCPELKTHAHCRNCPVYSSAALALLDRDLPPEYLSEWTVHFAEEKQIEERDAHSAIVFRIGSEWFALPTMVFDEVAEERPIHSLPHRRGGPVLGLANVRGELLICVSLAKLLGLEAASAAASGLSAAQRRLVVIRHESGRVAFPVDEVESAHRYRARQLQAVPATVVKAANAYTRAILTSSERKVGFLDSELIIQSVNRSVA